MSNTDRVKGEIDAIDGLKLVVHTPQGLETTRMGSDASSLTKPSSMDPSANRSLSVTIVNNNHWRWLEDCLDSLVAHPYTLGPIETIVLDNASEDGSVDAIREQFPSVVILERKTRRGFGENQNDAISHASGHYVFVLNPDAVVHAGTLDALVRALAWDESIAVAAGPDTGTESSLPISAPYAFPSPTNAIWRALGGNRFVTGGASQGKGIVRDGWVSGHAFMVASDRFMSVGGFDETFFLYSEEVDLMRRMQGQGWTIAWEPNATTTHIGKTSESANTASGQGESSNIATRTWVQFARSEVRYIRKHYGPLGTLLFRSASALDAAIRYVSTFLPAINDRMVAKGPSIEHTRLHHLTRLRVFGGLRTGPDMKSYAHDWNVSHDGGLPNAEDVG